MRDAYVCSVDPKINITVLFAWGVYFKYSCSKHKDIFEGVLKIQDAINILREYDPHFIIKLTNHLLDCSNCNEALRGETLLIEECTYICKTDPRFNYATLYDLKKYTFANENEREELIHKLTESFGEGFVKIAIEHIRGCDDCFNWFVEESKGLFVKLIALSK